MATEFKKTEDALVVALCGHSFAPAAIEQSVPLSSIDWSYVVEAARVHAVGSRLFPRALALPLPESARRAIARAARSTLGACIHDNLVFRQELAKVRKTFADDGVDWALLKGLSLDPTMMRSTGDIDILVRRERLVAAIESVLRIPGYAYREAAPSGREKNGWLHHPSVTNAARARICRQAIRDHEFQIVNRDRRVLVELHVRLFPRPSRGEDPLWGAASSEAVVQRIWGKRQRLPELGCSIPCAEHSLLLMCLHVALKRSLADNRFRLGGLVDIDVLISSGIRWDEFVRDCTELRLSPFAHFSLLLCRHLVGTPVPAAVLSALKASCTSLQCTLTRLHLRSIGSLDSSDLLFSAFCRALRPWALGGPWGDRLKSLLLVPVWLPPRRRMASLLGVELHSPLLILAYVLNPLRWLVLIVAAALGERRRGPL